MRGYHMFKITSSLRYPKHELPLTDFVNEYRKIYQETVDLFAEFDPCAIHNGTCTRGRDTTEAPSFCCEDCDHLTDNGCSVEALYCKLWTCVPVKKTLPKAFVERHTKLVHRAGKLCYYGGRVALVVYLNRFYGKEETEAWKITEMKSGSISSMSAR